jgi:hypothetical protein
MQQWRLGRLMYSLLIVLFLSATLTMIGCPDDDDDDDDLGAQQAQQLENRTLTFDAALFDPALAGLPAVLSFGEATENQLPFDLLLAGNNMGGTATAESLTLLIETITLPDGQTPATSVTINGVTFTVNQQILLDLVIEEVNGELRITLSNPRTGFTVTLVVDATPVDGEEDETEATLLANKTLTFHAILIDSLLSGQQAVMTFRSQAENTLPFTLTIDDVEITGSAIFSGADTFFVSQRILDDGQPVTEVTINTVSFGVGGTERFETDFDILGTESFQVTFTNPTNGVSFTFIFEPGQTGATGITGTGGDEEG